MLTAEVFVQISHPAEMYALINSYTELCDSLYRATVESGNIIEDKETTKGDIAHNMISTILDEYGETELTKTIRNLTKNL